MTLSPVLTLGCKLASYYHLYHKILPVFKKLVFIWPARHGCPADVCMFCLRLLLYF